MTEEKIEMRPKFFYNKIKAPEGKKFDLPADDGLRQEAIAALHKKGWVDTPDHFDVKKRKANQQKAGQPARAAK